MAVSGIPCGSVHRPLPHPAAAVRPVPERMPAEDPVLTSGPRESNGDPDDTGYSADPVAPRGVDLTA